MRNTKYGARLRKLVDAALTTKNASYECPKCAKKKVRRKGNSLWECRSCGAVFAGGAYRFTTNVGEIATRMIQEYEKGDSSG
jgi:large subunit ribosomal protein L37Ae